MAAPQQTLNPTYKDTSGIPRPRIDDFMFDPRDGGGYKLAKALGVGVQNLGDRYNKNKAALDDDADVIDAAHAQLGLEKFNRQQAGGTLDLVFGSYDPDAYAAKQGQLAGIDLAGSLNDRYMAEGMDSVDDPAAFSAWLRDSVSEEAEAAKAKGVGYYQAFIKEVGNGAEGMSRTWSGHAQNVVARKSATASKKRLKMSRDLDNATTNEKELQSWMTNFFVSESGGNFNAVFGDAGSQEDLSGLTLGELYTRQTTDGKNSAAGLIQLTPGTLKSLYKEGYTADMKYTPALQMEIGLTLMKRRGLREYLSGKMSEASFIDNLSKEWAGLKNSRGTGAYDNDGVNRATQSAADTSRALKELVFLMDENPRLKKFVMATDPKDPKTKPGSVILDTDATPTRLNSVRTLEDEEGVGVSNKINRDKYAELLVEDLESGKLSPDDVDAEVSTAKLNKEQRQMVAEAADSARATKEYASKRARRAQFTLLDKAIRSDDPEDLEALKSASRDTYDRLMKIKAGSAEVDTSEIEATTTEFTDSAAYGSEGFPEDAMAALMDGQISEDTYTAAMQQHEAQTVSNRVLRLPGVRKPVMAMEQTIPAPMRGDFRAALALVIADIVNNSEGAPNLSEIIDAAQKTAQQIAGLSQAKTDAIMARPEYNTGE